MDSGQPLRCRRTISSPFPSRAAPGSPGSGCRTCCSPGLNAHGRPARRWCCAPFCCCRVDLHAAVPPGAAASRTPIVAIAVTMVAAAASSVHWLARPHLFTLLFLVLFYSALERVREGRTRLAGMPYLAILPVATDSLDQSARRILRGHRDDRRLRQRANCCRCAFAADRSRGGRPACAARGVFPAARLACLAASLVNPYTYHLHAHMVAVPARSVPVAAHHGIPVAELPSSGWRCSSRPCCWCGALAAFWYAVAGPLYRAAAAAGVGARGAAGGAQYSDLHDRGGAPGGGGHAGTGWTGCREWNVAGLAARARPRDSTGWRPRRPKPMPSARWHLVSAAGAGCWWRRCCARRIRPSSSAPNSIPSLIRPARWPALRQDPVGAHLHLRPVGRLPDLAACTRARRVFVDGRSDFYGDDFEEQVRRRPEREVRLGEDPGPVRRRHDFIAPSAPLAGALKESSRWRVVYDDGVALVFRPYRRTPRGKPVSAASQRRRSKP